MGNLKSVIAVFIPGSGLAFRRKYFLGAAVFVVWVLAIEGYVAAKSVNPVDAPSYVRPAFLATVIVLSAATVLWEIIVFVRSRAKAAGRLEELYRSALARFAAGDDERAEILLREAVKLDPLDVDCLFLRAEVSRRMGNVSRARRLFRKCRDFDEKGKWKWEIDSALASL